MSNSTVTAWRSPLLARPGAVAADAPDEGVAAHYGDPYREQRALAEGEAVVDRSHRGVVRIAGADRLGWLHSLTTQHLERLEPGAPTEALVLDPNGRVEHHLVLSDDGEATVAHVEPGTAPALVAYLRSMQFLMRVEVSDVTDEWAVLSSRDGDRLVPRAELAEAAGGHLAGVAAYEALRVAAGRPRLGRETDHRTIPNEVRWLGAAVHLDKGCYRGQETVARVYNLGRPPRRLVLLHLDGYDDGLPSPGAEVTAEGRPVGVVTTPVRHYELGPIALAVIKRAVPDEAPLEAGGIAARIEPLPDDVPESPARRTTRPPRISGPQLA